MSIMSEGGKCSCLIIRQYVQHSDDLSKSELGNVTINPTKNELSSAITGNFRHFVHRTLDIIVQQTLV